MSSFQTQYQNKIGAARIDINKAIAGKKTNCKITYKVGKLGIDDSGSMKVLLRLVTDVANPQFKKPKTSNYVNITSSRSDINVDAGFKSGGVFGKVHERPWSKGFTVNFSGDYLVEGDEVYIEFKNWRMQTFYEETFEIKVLVDPFATARYIELPSSPEIEILPDKPARLVVVAPTKVKPGKLFKFLVKLEDKWGNPCVNLDGKFKIDNHKRLDIKRAAVDFEKGRAVVSAKFREVGVAYIKAHYKNLSGTSNPIVADKNNSPNQFWADLHGQTEETVGTNDIDHYFSFARDYAFLDITSIQGNDFQITNGFWKKINEVTKKFTKKGEFVAIPGYEWSGNTATGGDRNVLYKKESMPIYRSSHALIDDFTDIETDANSVSHLFDKLKKHGSTAMTIAHVGGRFADLDSHNDDVERAVEVHSDWGTFEWFLFDALEKEYTVGVVANSDGHTGRPGASYPSYAHFNNVGGLTCVMAKNLDRNSIFEAIADRHTYATTGVRVYLDVEALVSGEFVGTMGDKIKLHGQKTTLKIKYFGTAPVERLEIYNKSLAIHKHFVNIRNSKGKTIKILWSGSKVKGRRRGMSWEGNLRIAGNKIEKLKTINFYNQKNTVSRSEDKASWNGGTTGGVQGLILDLQKSAGRMEVLLNDKRFKFDLAKLTSEPEEFDMGGLDAKLQVYQTHRSDSPGEVSLDFTPETIKKGTNPVFVKVTQKDGNMVWSSPFYFSA